MRCTFVVLNTRKLSIMYIGMNDNDSEWVYHKEVEPAWSGLFVPAHHCRNMYVAHWDCEL